MRSMSCPQDTGVGSPPQSEYYASLKQNDPAAFWRFEPAHIGSHLGIEKNASFNILSNNKAGYQILRQNLHHFKSEHLEQCSTHVMVKSGK